jgi:hypothetical protein
MPGGQDELVCVQNYIVTAGDRLRGEVTNQAQVSSDELPTAVSNTVAVAILP